MKNRRHIAPWLFIFAASLAVSILLHGVTPARAAGILPTPTGLCFDDYYAGQEAGKVPNKPIKSSCKGGVCPKTGKPCDYAVEDFKSLIANIANYILGITGSVVLALFIYGGFLLLYSQGERGAVEKGKHIIVGSAVGLLLIFGAVTIVRVVLKTLGVDPSSGIYNVIQGQPLQGGAGAGGGAAQAAPTYCCVTASLIKTVPITANCIVEVDPGIKASGLACSVLSCCLPAGSGAPSIQTSEACADNGGTPTPLLEGPNNTPCK